MEEIKTTELNSDIIEKIKREVPDMIREFMEKDLVKMILYGSCARGDFKDYSDVDIALLMKGSRMDSWVYNDKIDEKIEKLVYERLNKKTAYSEYQSWMNSMQYMYKVLENKAIPSNSIVGIKLYG